jgi:SAM-dependent methyltransferase
VDISFRALQEVSGPAVVAYGEALPFRDGVFSCVTNLGSLEHFLDPLSAVREMARVMAPGGKALILVPNSFYSGDIWRVIRTGLGPDHHQDPQRFATAGEWRCLLEEGGLPVEKVMRYNKFKWWKDLLPFHLAYAFLFRCRRGTG